MSLRISFCRVLATAVLFVSTCPHWSRATGWSPTKEQQVDALVSTLLKGQAPPSAAMGISINGAPVWKKGFGLIEAEKQPNPDTLYPIGSVSKQFTAFAILKLIEAGAEVPFSKQSPSLDTPVSHFSISVCATYSQ